MTTEHEARSHVLAVKRVALGHHNGGLEHSVRDLGNGELPVVSLLGGDDGSEGGQHEVDASRLPALMQCILVAPSRALKGRGSMHRGCFPVVCGQGGGTEEE